MNYYVFHISGREYFDNLVIGHSVWGLVITAGYRNQVAAGDKVLFYLTGTGNQFFLGAATLASGCYKDETHESDSWYGDANVLRIDLVDVIVFPEPRPRTGLQWRPQMGAVSRISPDEYNAVVARIPMRAISIPVGAQTEEAQEFALEKYLEDFIVSNWHAVFHNLELYKDLEGNTGQQFFTDVGYVDLLATDKNGDFVVIELKKGRKNDEVVGQVLRYMGWIRENLATAKGVGVRGLIITGEKDPKLTYALKELGDKVKLKHYNIHFKLIDPK